LVNQRGEVVALGSNRDGGLALARPQPVGSLAKIAAALALGPTDQPSTRYCRGPGCEALHIFARSLARPLEHRLSRVPEASLSRAFAALGWHVPPGEAARRHAVYGGLEESAATVLRAVTAVTDNLAHKPQTVSLPHVVHSVKLRDGKLRDGRTMTPQLPSLPAEPLARALVEPTRSFAIRVLEAPIKERAGTAHRLAAVLDRPDIGLRWAKTGTANADGGENLTRTSWVAGGFVHRAQPFAFLVLVTAPSNRVPLGHVEARDVAVPLAAALLSASLDRLAAKVTDR